MRDTVLLRPTGGVYLSAGTASTTAHEAHCFKLLVPLDGSTVQVSGEASAQPLIVSPNHQHSACSTGPSLTALLRPELASIECFERLAHSPVVALTGKEASLVVDLATRSANGLEDLAAAPVALFGAIHAGELRQLHPTVVRVLERLQDQPELGFQSAAKGLGSPYHVCRLFRREVGLTFTRWRLWQRLLAAFAAVVEGESLAMAAAITGFSDQAHLTRTCRRLVGRSPGGLLLRNCVQ